MAPDEERIERSLQRAAEAEEEARGERRDLLITLAVCVLWAALGLFLVMWSAHTDNVDHGRIALGAGLVIGNGGILVTLIHAWYRAQRKG